jgi:solute carrier family 24 (sodium/potassium/calcium exchanger), member 6
VLALSVAFFYLAFVADEHLSPSLQRISKTFRFSESLAGVTLLAFGAGASDVFASLSASEEADIEGI